MCELEKLEKKYLILKPNKKTDQQILMIQLGSFCQPIWSLHYQINRGKNPQRFFFRVSTKNILQLK